MLWQINWHVTPVNFLGSPWGSGCGHDDLDDDYNNNININRSKNMIVFIQRPREDE